MIAKERVSGCICGCIDGNGMLRLSTAVRAIKWHAQDVVRAIVEDVVKTTLFTAALKYKESTSIGFFRALRFVRLKRTFSPLEDFTSG